MHIWDLKMKLAMRMLMSMVVIAADADDIVAVMRLTAMAFDVVNLFLELFYLNKHQVLYCDFRSYLKKIEREKKKIREKTYLLLLMLLLLLNRLCF